MSGPMNRHPGMPRHEYWEQADVVEAFACREPDEHLMALVNALAEPATLRVLDLGCAAGRNTVFLAERGCDVHALDASQAMVAKTRRRVSRVLGRRAAHARVSQGRMDDLSRFADNSFLLLLALGVYQNAGSTTEWERALDEAARVLAPGGLLFVGHLTPDTDPTGKGATHPVEGEKSVFEMPGGRSVLVSAEMLTEALRRRGLEPIAPPETRVVELDGGGRRVSVDLLARKTS